MQARDETFQTSHDSMIHDFVLLCFLGGNDFLPRLPTIYIGEQGTRQTCGNISKGLSQIFSLYQESFVSLGGYITNNANINFSRLVKFISSMKEMEQHNFAYIMRTYFVHNIDEHRKKPVLPLPKKTFKAEIEYHRQKQRLPFYVRDKVGQYAQSLADAQAPKNKKYPQNVVEVKGTWKEDFYCAKFGIEKSQVGAFTKQLVLYVQTI